MYDPTFAVCLLTVLGGYVGAFWLLNHEWGAPAVEPVRTDPGREAVTALTQPRPFPSGLHRLPSPGAEFEARRRTEAA